MTPEAVAKQLERRAQFCSGVKALQDLVASRGNNTSQFQGLWPIIQRCFTILKTRHTAPGSWRSGKQLFESVRALPCLLPDQRSKVDVWIKEAQGMLGDEDIPSSASAAATQPGAAGEQAPADVPEGAQGLLDLLTLVRQVPRESHYDDAGPIVDDEERWQRAQGSAPPAAGGEPGGEDGGAAAGSSQQAPNLLNRAAARAELQRQILEGLNAVYSGIEAVTRGTAAVEAELEAVLGAVSERQGKKKPPPASKKMLEQCKRAVTAEWLAGRGGDVPCAVCMDSVAEGEEVVVLPCGGSHVFHPPCVTPWFNKTNSCPVCRQELATDDHHYEAAKEREREEAEERAGAANALSHNEFMYI